MIKLRSLVSNTFFFRIIIRSLAIIPSWAAFRSSVSFQNLQRSQRAMVTRNSFLSTSPQPLLQAYYHRPFPTSTGKHRSNVNYFRYVKSQDDADDNGVDDYELQRRDGMAQAFRELEDLNSFGGNSSDGYEDQESTGPRKTPLVKIVEPAASTKPPTPEEEVKLYAKMVQELEDNNENDLYSDFLTEMGGTVQSSSRSFPSTVSSPVSSSFVTVALDADTSSTPLDEAWMNQALQEALQEANKASPTEIDRESVLNDQELMQEIEKVFDQAHEKLMTSLDEIRYDQAQWTANQKSSSFESSSSSKVAQDYRENAERLTQAESTLTSLLDKVQKETQNVEEAVQELERAQKELSNDFLSELRQGGIIKQVTLVGALLFSMRTLGYIVTDYSSPDALTGIVVQGAIAVAFFLLFNLLK